MVIRSSRVTDEVLLFLWQDVEVVGKDFLDLCCGWSMDRFGVRVDSFMERLGQTQAALAAVLRERGIFDTAVRSLWQREAAFLCSS